MLAIFILAIGGSRLAVAPSLLMIGQCALALSRKK